MKDIVCMSGVELLMEYLEGALETDVRTAIEAHVAGCPRCDAFVASYRETPRIVRDADHDGHARRPGDVAAGGVAPRHAPSRWIESRRSPRSLERARHALFTFQPSVQSGRCSLPLCCSLCLWRRESPPRVARIPSSPKRRPTSASWAAGAAVWLRASSGLPACVTATPYSTSGRGTGALTAAIATVAPSRRIVGIDPAAAYVAFAQSQHRSGRVFFEVGDAQQMRFDDAMFDRTLSLLVVNFIPDVRKARGEMTRVTKPKGTVAAAVWDYGEGMEMLRAFWEEAVALTPAHATKDERNMPLCRRGDLAALWRGQGLRLGRLGS